MSSATILVARPEIIRMSPVIRKFERRGMENFILREERKAQLHKSLYLEEIIRTGTRITRITRIGRIYTDPCVSVSTVAPVDVAHTYGSCHTWRSVFYRTPSIIDDDKKPQIKAPRVTSLEGVSTSTVAPVDVAHTYGSPPYVDIATRYALRGIRGCGVENPQGFGIDERRYIPVTDFAAQSNRSLHRKGRKERKAQKQISLRSGMKIIYTELVRTLYELTLPEFVSVRFSSLFFPDRINRMDRMVE